MGSGPQVVPIPASMPGTKSTLASGALAGTVVGLMLIISIPLIILWTCHRRSSIKAEQEKSRMANCSDWPWTWDTGRNEARKAHCYISEVDSSPIVAMSGSATFPVQLSDEPNAEKIEYYGKDQQDQVYELPADMIIQRQQSRPFDRPRHSRHGSTGQDSAISGLSELSDGDESAVPRPTLSRCRKTSGVSEKSTLSGVSTLRDDGLSSSTASPRIVSPIQEAHQDLPFAADSRHAGCRIICYIN